MHLNLATPRKLVLTLFCLFGIGLFLPIAIWLWTPGAQPSGTKADLIMVFPGRPERIAAGCQLAKAGYAPKFAISNAGLKAIEANMAQYGRPAAVEFVAASKSRSTFEDVFNTREIVRQHGIHSLLLVTSTWHMPRSYFLLKCFLAGTGVAVQAVPVADPRTVTGVRNALMLQAKLSINEAVKCWGSIVEMAWSLLTGTLLRDVPLCHELGEFIKQKILFADPLAAAALS